jgi:hypothetical protein
MLALGGSLDILRKRSVFYRLTRVAMGLCMLALTAAVGFVMRAVELVQR